MGFIPRLVARTERHAAGLALVIALLAVALSAAATIMAGDAPKSLDETAFQDIARNLAFEGAFANAEGELTAYRAPGLVFFLAPFVKLGAGLMELRLTQAVLFGLTLVLLYNLFRRHGGPLAGLLAMAMVPLWPVALYASTTLYPQTLAGFLLVASVSLLDRMRDAVSLWSALLAGLVIGALVLTLPITLLLFPVFLGWVALRGSRRVAQCVLVLVVSALVVGSWTYRNHKALDAFVPVATSSGYNLLLGNAPNARYDTSTEIRFPEYVYTELTGKTEAERNKVFTKAALDEIAKDPQRFVTLYAAKFLHWFDYSNKLVSDQVEELEHGASGVDVSLRELVLLVTYLLVIVGPLALRLLMLRRVPLKDIEVLALCLWVAAGLAYALFFTRVRFRLPFDLLIIGMNAMFLAALLRQLIPGVKRRSLARE